MCDRTERWAYQMQWGMIACDDCNQTYTVRIRDGGSAVLTTEDQQCTRCGGESFSRIDGPTTNS